METKAVLVPRTQYQHTVGSISWSYSAPRRMASHTSTNAGHDPEPRSKARDAQGDSDGRCDTKARLGQGRCECNLTCAMQLPETSFFPGQPISGAPGASANIEGVLPADMCHSWRPGEKSFSFTYHSPFAYMS